MSRGSPFCIPFCQTVLLFGEPFVCLFPVIVIICIFVTVSFKSDLTAVVIYT